MGKKGGKKKKKARNQARQQTNAGRPMTLEQQKLQYDRKNDDIARESRVWYTWECSGGQWCRGIVEGCHSLEEPHYEIIDVVDDPKGPNYSHIPSGKGLVFRDVAPWTLRFRPRDRVICKPEGIPIPMIVTRLFPVSEWQDSSSSPCKIPLYECRLDKNFMLQDWNCNTTTHVIYEDTDSFIQRHPVCVSLDSTSIRFTIGEGVRFDVRKAQVLEECNVQGWRYGTIVSCTQKEDYLTAYVCEFKLPDGRSCRARIPFDTDEYIAKTISTGYERFLEAVEQDCSYEHLQYLVESTGLDLSKIPLRYSRTGLLTKAIESASYNGLLFLRNNVRNVDLKALRDKKGNGLLHQIAKSPNADRFFDNAGSNEWKNEQTLGSLFLDGDIIKQRNNDDKTWFDELVASGNLRALDVVTSPNHGFSWILVRHFDEGSPQVGDIQNFELKNMLHEFIRFRDIFQLSERFVKSNFGGEGAEIPGFVREIDDETFGWAVPPRTFLRFYSELTCLDPCANDERRTIQNVVCSLAACGYIDALNGLTDIDSTLREARIKAPVSMDRNEYLEIERQGDKHMQDRTESLNLISCAARGDRKTIDISKVSPQMRKMYSELLSQYANDDDQEDLSNFLEGKLDDATLSPQFKEYLEHRIRCLSAQNDGGSNGRILERCQVIAWLSDGGQDLPDPLDVIRWREAGVLTWLIQTKKLNLSGFAYKDLDLDRPFSRELAFLGGQAIQREKQVWEILSFAAIEFDDLRTFILLDSGECPFYKMLINGMNALHACAAFGRMEIILWFRKKGYFNDLLRAECTRKRWFGWYAAHIAAERGFTTMADLLLELGSPVRDAKGVLVTTRAMQSKTKAVRDWAESKERSLAFEEDLSKLSTLLDLASGNENNSDMRNHVVTHLKTHIAKTNCMSVIRWVECNVCLVHSKCPTGTSYLTLLDKLCNLGDPTFVGWLSFKLLPSQEEIKLCQKFWGNAGGSQSWVCSRDDVRSLRSFADRINDELLSRCLTYRWSMDVSCEFLAKKKNPMYARMTRSFEWSDRDILGDSLHRLHAFRAIEELALVELETLIVTGAPSGEVDDILSLSIEIATVLAAADGLEYSEYICDRGILSPKGEINLDYYVTGDFVYEDAHPLQEMLEWREKTGADVSKLFLLLAIEGYDELISWSLSRKLCNWSPSKEVSVIRIAAFLGNSDVINCFLSENCPRRPNRLLAAILGAVEAGRSNDVHQFLKMIECSDELSSDVVLEACREQRFRQEEHGSRLHSSLLGTVVVRILEAREEQRRNYIGMAKILATHTRLLDSASILHLARHLIPSFIEYAQTDVFGLIEVLTYLMQEMDLNLWQSQDDIYAAIDILLIRFDLEARKSPAENMLSSQHALLGFLMGICDAGFSIQKVEYASSDGCNESQRELASVLSSMKSNQLRFSAKVGLIVERGSLEEIQTFIDKDLKSLNTKYDGGALFSHVAAKFDRLDVLEWLVEEYSMSLYDTNGYGHSVADVAAMNNATKVTLWIEQQDAARAISLFVSSHFRRRAAASFASTLIRSIKAIQAWARGNVARKTFHGQLVASRLEQSQRFQSLWSPVKTFLDRKHHASADSSWTALKQCGHDVVSSEQLDKEISGNVDMLSEISRTLDEATMLAMVEQDSDEESEAFVEADINDESAGLVEQPVLIADFDRVKMTGDVVKWLRQADGKYRSFFVRRVGQLAAGERSRILAKRLTGCETLIFETYLEQKSGHRILWTHGNDNTLLIWYVAKHKNVSRLIRLIDDAESRSSRQLTSAESLHHSKHEVVEVEEEESSTDERIMLDPLGDTPLKLYEVYPDEIEKLVDPLWQPRLFLTTREREVVETSGTVLLLGRSGTGKTCIICNRMDYDRLHNGESPGFSQLFIARSQRLREYVKEAVDVTGLSRSEEGSSMKFAIFSEVVHSLEAKLPRVENARSLFRPSHRMTFGRFKREVYRSESAEDLDALVVWTNIRSFIKGSIEALLSTNRILSEEEYMALGKRRCRLSPQQRENVYDVFKLYESYMKQNQLWDDCDRIAALVSRLEHARVSDTDCYFDAKYSKLYVDEVQDYTQAEIALFFYLSGPGDLFLAGDPAQSVAEGVEFRFEEIRSVGYHLYGEDRRQLIPNKPKTVHLNFRSHKGILDVAAAVLSCLFRVFPDSAKQLKEDSGLFQGPRPGVFHKVDALRLQELISKREGVVVLTHDENVARVRRSLNGYPLVYGIREAKGLEFREVILLDFFNGLPELLQKLWRDLLLDRDTTEVSRRPEIEGHLKLLYTAVTRCIQRLFLAETSSSFAGDAFVRWLTKPNDSRRVEVLAVKSNVDNVETMVRTPDEWISAGLDNAIAAESCEEWVEAQGWLDKAIYCFGQVNDIELASRARAHRSSLAFRIKMDESQDIDAKQVEAEAALLMEKLLAERLYGEAKDVCDLVHPLLEGTYGEMFEKQVYSKMHRFFSGEQEPSSHDLRE